MPIFILINTDMKNPWAWNSPFEISFNIIAIYESKMSIVVKKNQSLGTKGRNLIRRFQDNKVGPVITARNRAADDLCGFWNEVLWFPTWPRTETKCFTDICVRVFVQWKRSKDCGDGRAFRDPPSIWTFNSLPKCNKLHAHIYTFYTVLLWLSNTIAYSCEICTRVP